MRMYVKCPGPEDDVVVCQRLAQHSETKGCVTGLASYVAVLNLPLKRADIKKRWHAWRATLDSVTTAMAEVRFCGGYR